MAIGGRTVSEEARLGLAQWVGGRAEWRLPPRGALCGGVRSGQWRRWILREKSGAWEYRRGAGLQVDRFEWKVFGVDEDRRTGRVAIPPTRGPGVVVSPCRTNKNASSSTLDVANCEHAIAVR